MDDDEQSIDLPDWIQKAETDLEHGSVTINHQKKFVVNKYEKAIYKLETALSDLKSILTSLKSEHIPHAQQKVSEMESNKKKRVSMR